MTETADVVPLFFTDDKRRPLSAGQRRHFMAVCRHPLEVCPDCGGRGSVAVNPRERNKPSARLTFCHCCKGVGAVRRNTDD